MEIIFQLMLKIKLQENTNLLTLIYKKECIFYFLLVQVQNF